jgi:hypothetical protein
MMRGQANLVGVAVALLVVTTATGLGLALADGAFASAQRQPAERRVAVSLAERLVSAESPLTTRANVMTDRRLGSVTSAALDAEFPVARGYDVRIRLGDRVLVDRGTPAGGISVRRLVLVERRQSTTIDAESDRLTLPRRSDAATVRLDPPADTTATTVRANGRVVLHDPAGLDGSYDVDLSRYETTTLTVEHSGSFPAGSLAVTYSPARTTKAELVVTVDG